MTDTSAPITTGGPDTSVVVPDDLPWATLQPGMEFRPLRIGEGSGTYTVQTRFAPGTAIPTHRHHGCVHAWTVAGEWTYREYPWVARAGDYVYEAPGSVHTLEIPATATEPAVVTFVIEGAQDYLDDDGNVILVQTAETVRDFYAGQLAAEGRAWPAGVLA